MRSRTRRGLSLGLLGLVLSCQQAPDLTDELNEYERVVNEANSEACRCPMELGYDSMVECGDALGTVTNEDVQCLAGVLDGNEEIGRDYLDCASSAYRFHVQCLGLNPSCEEGENTDCTADLAAALAACPQLPADIRPSFFACIE
ncbi:hypothetical protein [Enhygromyxa salina]|uniref:Lipoprotein n=1 Tax=Enhygromyxa salina TaxID=215803 RepID=A0A2S9YAJ7_9BACT|nr:hypothetical protein [Enhygromyxa salina]PRQ02041.1 hypothetical protein ENSA7_56140 [Enhygromyxa salina]